MWYDLRHVYSRKSVTLTVFAIFYLIKKNYNFETFAVIFRFKNIDSNQLATVGVNKVYL